MTARIQFSDGAEHVLTRRLRDDSEGSITLIDGVVAELSTLGIVVSDAVYPVVAQHSLQSFIHTKPKERRDAISEALAAGTCCFKDCSRWSSALIPDITSKLCC